MTWDELTFLIDTNIFIAAEQHAEEQGHSSGAGAARFMRLAAKLDFRVVLSAGTAQDVRNAKGDLGRRRRRALEKYHVLEPAFVSSSVEAAFPEPRRQQHTHDMQVAAAFASGLARFLVTNDSQLRARLARLGLSGVLSLAEAIDYLETLSTPTVALPPAVELVAPQSVNLEAPLFDSLRADYPFNEWWRNKVVAEHRDVAIIGDPKAPDAVAVYKEEVDASWAADAGARVLKICTFKASVDGSAIRRGELLLKSTVEYARRRGLREIYLEVGPHRTELVAWLPRFGFHEVNRKDNGELVFVKTLEPAPTHRR